MKKLMIGLLCIMCASVITGCCLFRPPANQRMPIPTVDNSVNVYQDGGVNNVQMVQVIRPEFVAADGSSACSSFQVLNLGGNTWGSGGSWGGSSFSANFDTRNGGPTGNAKVRTQNPQGHGRNTQSWCPPRR